MIEVDIQLRRDDFTLDARFDSASDAIAIFGPSGAGKSTVLSVIAGLLRLDSGRICVDGDVLVDTAAGVWLAPHKRRVGVVFQDSLLFPHMSVESNLRYGEKAAPAVTNPVHRFDALVSLLGVERLLSRRPDTLSGGERQRVAIGRALLAQPRLLLLDEPLASLDYARRQEIMPYLARVRRELGIPMIYVSHALEEVVRLADDVILMRDGSITDHGRPQDLLVPVSHDEDSFGVVSVLEATISRFDEQDSITELEHPAGRVSLPGKIGQPGETHRILVRATDVAIAVARPREISHRTILRGRVTACQHNSGPLVRLDIALTGHGRLAALVTRRSVNELAIDVGDEIFALAKSSAIDDRAFAHAPGQ